MEKTVSFISRRFGKYDPWNLKDYEAHDGFKALRKALAMDGGDIANLLSANGVQGRGGVRLGVQSRQVCFYPGIVDA